MFGTINNLIAAVGKIPGATADLLKLQGEAGQWLEQIQSLKEENAAPKDKLKTKEHVVFRNDRIWLKQPDGSLEGPYCPPCYEGRRAA